MFGNSFSAISVCEIISENFMTRLLDVQDGRLVIPYIQDGQERIYGNRDRIYHTEKVWRLREIGVWKWTAEQNEKDPSKDYIKSHLQTEYHPIRVCVIDEVSSDEGLIETIKSGFTGFWPNCDTLIAYPKKGIVRGVLCKASRLHEEGSNSVLNDDVYALPVYEIKEYDIVNPLKNLAFYKYLNLPEQKSILSIGETDTTVKGIILNRLTWPFFKENIEEGTKQRWRDCKEALEKLGDNTLYTDVSEKLNCNEATARQKVDDFIKRANTLIDDQDIDSEVLAYIAMNHEGLKVKCEESLEQHWLNTKDEELQKMSDEIDELQKQANEQKTKIRESIKKEEQAVQQKIKELEAMKQTEENEYNELLVCVSSSKSELAGILTAIEKNEILGNEVKEATNLKIAEARANVADFLAELSMFMPQGNISNNVSTATIPLNTWTFQEGVKSSNPKDVHSWKEIVGLLSNNLNQAGVAKKQRKILAAFLCSAYIHQIDLLLIGPNNMAIANAMSMALSGQSVPVLSCFGECAAVSLDQARSTESQIVAVENPCHPDWMAQMAHYHRTHGEGKQQLLWLHPFVEDLLIEPKSLYNYVYPVFTEPFVNSEANESEMVAGRREKEFQEYQQQNIVHARNELFDGLKVNTLLKKRMCSVLDDAKALADQKDSSIEFLLAVLPFTVLLEKKELLQELLEDSKLPDQIQKEIELYIENE